MAATDPQTAELPEPGDRVRVTSIGPHGGCGGILLTRGPFAHAILLDKDAHLGSGGTRFFRPVELDWLRPDNVAAEGVPADPRTAADERMQARLDYIDSRTGAVHMMALLEAELARTKAELEQWRAELEQVRGEREAETIAVRQLLGVADQIAAAAYQVRARVAERHRDPETTATRPADAAAGTDDLRTPEQWRAEYDTDGAAADLAECLNDLTYTVRDWTLYPHSDMQRRAAREALDKADQAFAEYVCTLDAQAAGPSGDGR